ALWPNESLHIGQVNNSSISFMSVRGRLYLP
ncbi:hypothetical protein AZ017_005059, partial [Klebsiella pneumoniae]